MANAISCVTSFVTKQLLDKLSSVISRKIKGEVSVISPSLRSWLINTYGDLAVIIYSLLSFGEGKIKLQLVTVELKVGLKVTKAAVEFHPHGDV